MRMIPPVVMVGGIFVFRVKRLIPSQFADNKIKFFNIEATFLRPYKLPLKPHGL